MMDARIARRKAARLTPAIGPERSRLCCCASSLALGTRQATLQGHFHSAKLFPIAPSSRSCLLRPAQSSTTMTPAAIKSP